ncbi:MAG TPA: hypothetical protein VE869_16465 [Gemmatimonas sp.]|nr:hypothetical protein [Gemmatimonas sp.]
MMLQPGRAVGQSSPPRSPSAVADALDAVGDAPARAAIRQTIEAAGARGVPVDPLLTKVREGVAKRSDPRRISDAVQQLAARLETAAQALAPAFSSSELSAGAGALHHGVSASTLKAYRALSPSAPLTVPLGVLTEMIADGVPSKLASGKIRDLVSRGATPALLIDMGAKVRADVMGGIAPGVALELRSKGVISLLASPASSAVSGPIRPEK